MIGSDAGCLIEKIRFNTEIDDLADFLFNCLSTLKELIHGKIMVNND